MASTVKKRISAYSTEKTRNEERETASVQRQKQSAADLLSKAVRAKIEDGNVKAAVRILLSEDTGAAEPRGSGGQLTPTFSGAGSTYGA